MKWEAASFIIVTNLQAEHKTQAEQYQNKTLLAMTGKRIVNKRFVKL